MRVVISGGGTGGHIYPAIAIADALKERNKEIEILFIGAEGRMEMEKVPKAGYPIKGLWISGLQRRLTLKNVLFPIKVLHSIWKSRFILKKFNPNIIVGVGGYASGPALYAASWMKIPIVLQEQNSYPGITNKLLASKADKICTGYPDMKKFFDDEKTIFTGNPVRKDLLNLTDKKKEALAHFDLDHNKKTILIFGGSLGARSLNEAMQKNNTSIANWKHIQVIWQIGQSHMTSFSETETAKLNHVKPMKFIDRMDLAYAVADLIICRAGALTISELALVAKPAILVPSPYVSEDHQTKNANALIEREAAILITDTNITKKLIDTAENLLSDEMRQKLLSKNLASMAKPNAANEIAGLISKIAVE